MRERRLKKTLAFIVMMCMVFTMAYTPLGAAYAATSTVSKWTALDGIEDAAAAENPVAITMTKTDTGVTYLLNAATTSTAPQAPVAEVDEETLTADGDGSAYSWTITPDEEEGVPTGTYSIANGSDSFLYLTATNNGLRVGTKPDVGAAWSVSEDGYLSAVDSKGAIRYVGVYLTNPDWRCYEYKDNTIPGNVSGQELRFWELTGTEEIEEPDIPTNTFDKLVGAPADGAKVAIYHPASGMAMTGTASGARLAGIAGVVEDGKLTVAEDAVILDVTENGGVLQFTNADGKVLTSGATGSSLTFADDAKSDLAKWKAEEQADGTWYLMNVGAAFNGNHNQALEYYNGFTTYGVKENDSQYKFEFYGEQGVPKLSKIGFAPQDGASVAIYHPKSGMALSATASGTKLAGTAVTIENDKMLVTEDLLRLSVTLEDEVYTFASPDGKFLTSGETGNSLTFAEDGASDLAKWKVEEQADGTWYLMNVGAAYNGNHNQALEYYNGFTTYGVKENSADYKFEFYGTSDPAPDDPDPGEQASFGLASTIADGDEVIIYNAASGTGLGNVVSGSSINAVALKPTEGVITTDNESVVWKVNANADGTYTFTQGENVLGGKENGTRGQLVVSGADHTALTLVGPDETDFNYFLKFDGWTSSYGTFYVEYYNGFTAYSSNNPGKDQYGITFYKKDAEPETPETPDPGEQASFGLASTIADGDEVIIYNAASGTGLGNVVSGNSINAVALKPTEGVITTDNESVVWKVNANADGTYTFTQGENVLGGKENGTRGQLVVSGADHTALTLVGPDETDFNYFLQFNGWTNSFGTFYVEYYNGFTAYSSNDPGKDQYGITFYKKDAEPETPDPGEIGDLITDLSQLTDGMTVVIYSPGHGTAVSSKPNGDWYLKANNANVEDGKIKDFTVDLVWKVKVNDDGTYSFYANDDETKSITVWPSGNYAELSVDVGQYPDNTWTLSPASTKNRFYISSATVSGSRGPAYVEAYVRNETEVFSGYFTSTSSYNFNDNEFGLQFIKVNPEDALAAYDDGEWDGVMEKGAEYVVYNTSAESSLGLFKEANYAFDAIPTTIEDGKASPGNGAYTFKVDTMGRYYSFEVDGKYLATNDAEELFFEEPNEDGSVPEHCKWFLKRKEDAGGGYVIYNKECSYGGTPVCIEYFSSVFSGWTFSANNDVKIYLFNFYKVADDVNVHNGIVQKPSVIFECDDFRYVEQDFPVTITMDDLAPEVTEAAISFEVNGKTYEITDYETTPDKKNFTFLIPASDIDIKDDAGKLPGSFKLNIEVKNSYDISYEGERTVGIVDQPFFTDVKPGPNEQTGDDMRPVISAKVGNAGNNPRFTFKINGKDAEGFEFKDGVISYTPTEDFESGRVAVDIEVVREDGMANSVSWAFTAGKSDFQLYYGQLHSHTTYSDGSGTLDTALEYIESLPESANVQFVAFTDHSNYFDSTKAANPADAINDKELMTPASKALWEGYKQKVADFNAKQKKQVAIAGFEMTWSGGPGHINTFDSDGLVSRNNAELNNKTGDAGMKLYYESINKGDSLSQFNHPGKTFGNFTDFSYWNEETDNHMFLVEVGNGEGQIGAGGYYPSYSEYDLALSKGWHVAPTNNQDNHKGRWGNANDARDVVLTNDFSEQGIYEAIRNLRVYATEDKNLAITYTVNGEQMGSIFETTPEKLNVDVSVFDPDNSDVITKVELITENGIVAYTWDNNAELSGGALSAEIDPKYSYYYVRVTQGDKDTAVTAPVWVSGKADIGLGSVAVSPEGQADLGQEVTLTTSFFNNEAEDAKIKSIAYAYKDGDVIHTDEEAKTLEGGKTLNAEFKFTPETGGKSKIIDMTVTAVVEINDKDYTFKKDIDFEVIASDMGVTPIAKVQADTEAGDIYVIEGVVTSNASGYDKDTAFFDCVYVQDETAGICIFPVSGEYKIGDKVRVMGSTDWYQGEAELQVKSIELIGEGAIVPTDVTAAQINDLSVLGSLVSLKGTIESFEEENGLIQTIMIKDANGGVARVFIDGYITTGKEVEGCKVGADILAIGLASYDDTFNAPKGPFPRIRIRNRADILCGDLVPPEPAEVEEAIKALPDMITVNGEASVINARSLYNRLSAEDKKEFPIELLLKLQIAEAALTAAKAEEKADATREIAACIMDGNKVKTGNFKTSTVTPFKKALAAAEQAFRNPASTAEDLRAASAALAKAHEGLVLKIKNPMTVKAKTTNVKYSKLRKKTQTVKRSKVLTVKKNKGKLTYKKLSGNSKITVNKKTGKVTVKKGLKKGLYKVKVRVTAAGNANYKSKSLTRTFKIRVK